MGGDGKRRAHRRGREHGADAGSWKSDGELEADSLESNDHIYGELACI